MPIITSAKKRVRVAQKAAIRNARTKRTIKSAVKTLRAKYTQEHFQKAQSALDQAVKKGVLHKNKAARKKRQLAAAAKAAGLKLGKKATAKKSTTKPVRQASKPVVKKTAARTTSKKPASKKTPARKATKK